MTPRYFDALRKRHQRRVQDGEYMLAQLTAAVINFSICRPKTPAAVSDLMPSWPAKKAAKKPKKPKSRSPEVIRTEVRKVFDFLRGK